MARKYKQGIFVPENPQKYAGNLSNIVYRSGWEMGVFKWCDLNPDVIMWASEEVCVPYVGPDEKVHKYFIDLALKYRTGAMVLVEIKPKSQTREPEARRGKKKSTLLEETQTFLTNEAKWKAAGAFAEKRGMTFQIWHEDVLRAIGIPHV